MRVLWLYNGLMPAACAAMGYKTSVYCSWLEPMLSSLVEVLPDSEFCMLGWDSRTCDVTVGRVRYVSLGLAGRDWYRSTPKIIQSRIKGIISSFRPDIVHIQGTEYPYGCLREDVYGGAAIVVSLQGLICECWIHMSGGLAPWQMRVERFTNLRALIKGGGTVYKTQHEWWYGRAMQENRILKQHHYFIGRTDWDHMCLRAANVTARYYHVNESLRSPFYYIRRSRKSIRQHSIYCGAAFAYPLKGGHWLLQAISILRREFPDIQLRAADAQRIMGKPSLCQYMRESTYFAFVRRRIKELGIVDNVVPLPLLSATEVADELSRAELYVSPSLCENSPNSLCEAMIVGTPAIHTLVGGAASLVESGRSGLLVAPYDAYSLADAIRKMFLEPDLAEMLADEARKKSFVRHDVKRNALNLVGVYDDILNNSNHPHAPVL